MCKEKKFQTTRIKIKLSQQTNSTVPAPTENAKYHVSVASVVCLLADPKCHHA